MLKYTYQDVCVPEEIVVGPLKQISPLVLKILYKRGYQTTEAMIDFLFGDFSKVLSVTEMQGTAQALPLLKQTIKQKEQIVIYQDYDVDGCSAGALCLECLNALHAKVNSYVNDRELDGYGICKNGVDQILAKYPDVKLILTVDNGIVAYEGINYARSKGLQVIVTDHHMPGSFLPDAEAVIDPKRADEFYPFHELCGTGVAFKLMLALYDYMGKDSKPVLNTIDLVALATVADVVPLVGENRLLVQEGLRMMNAGSRPAFRVMKDQLQVDEINAQYTIAYQFAPMINALSRMGEDSYRATEVLLSDDRAFLEKEVSELIQINLERKQETSLEEEIALSMLDENNLPSAIILKHDSFSEGIVGIVAGRLKSKYHRPVIVFAPSGNGVWKASGRSIEEFPMKENLDKIANLMLGYGGHAKAAGLSIEESKFETFKAAVLSMTDQLDPVCFVEERELDDVLTMDQVNIKQIQALRILEPYGEGNPNLIFGLRMHYDVVRFMGENDKHVKYWDRETNVSVLDFGGGDAEKDRQNRHVRRTKVIGTMELNEFNGKVSPQFKVK